ncbi:NfeD family protein [Aestuariimicrobium ganziense]|uniref:NfeD family protein n=1 Tax=Aestuariimicrobium ganziense TaxID=2773677 RepID=UPI0019418B2E|nr:NfeD family protein [Aestuariimicrobium ganziense]
MLLGVAEMLTLDLTLLMLAAGALAGAGTAAVFPDAWLAQVLVALAVAGLSLFLLRPTLLAKVRNAPGYRNSVNKLVGSTATATAEISVTGGEVKVDGQLWTARTLDSSVRVLPGQLVEIYEVEGTTLVVYPSERGLPYRNTGL